MIEGEKERIQVFAGVVIRRSRGGIRATFTVRKVSYGVGVERTFPIHSPRIDKIEVVTRGHVRRAKLYYLRGLSGKAARITAEKTDKPGEKPDAGRGQRPGRPRGSRAVADSRSARDPLRLARAQRRAPWRAAAAATRQSPSSCAPSCTTSARVSMVPRSAPRGPISTRSAPSTSPSTRPSTTSVVAWMVPST